MCDTLSLLYFSFPSCWPPCTAPSQRCHVIRALPYYSKAPSPVGPLSLTESLIMGHSHSCELILVCFTCLSLCALVRPLHFFWGSLNYSSLCHFHLLLLPFSLEFLRKIQLHAPPRLGLFMQSFWIDFEALPSVFSCAWLSTWASCVVQMPHIWFSTDLAPEMPSIRHVGLGHSVYRPGCLLGHPVTFSAPLFWLVVIFIS